MATIYKPTSRRFLRLRPTHELEADSTTDKADNAQNAGEAGAGKPLRLPQGERPAPLARIRRNRGMTQQELSDAAGASLRMVQLYEQRQNDLSKESVSVVLALAHVLGCEPEDLLKG